MSATIKSLGVAALLLSGLACVVTPEPIPMNEAGGGFDSMVLVADGSADLMAGLDLMPPGGDTVEPAPDIGPVPFDASPPDLTMDGGPTEVGPPEGGPGEGGPQEAGPPEAGPPPDLGQTG